MRVAMCALVAVLMIGAGTASAGGRKGDLEIGGYAGYDWLGDYPPVFPKNHPLYGARLGYFISRHWSFEVSAQRIQSERDTIGDSKVNLDALRGNLMYDLNAGGIVRPFLTVGVGYEKFDPEGLNRFESKDVGYNAGLGLRIFLSDYVSLRGDGRFVTTKVDALDKRENNVELNGGLSFYFGGHSHHAHAEGEEHAEATVRSYTAPTVTCSADKTEILPGQTVTLTANAVDADGDGLTYEWSTTAGQIVGNGPTVTLAFDGVNGPTAATATVRVSDRHNHTVTCDTGVRLAEAQKPAESVSCLAGGFPRNLSRLTNVDKACLDDVVQRLRSDPRAHVVVIGHADTHETSAQRVGQQRADAVKSYLVSAGVESSRITTRSAGDSHPLGTGTDVASMSQNRRCEVWFVPEGAADPQ